MKRFLSKVLAALSSVHSVELIVRRASTAALRTGDTGLSSTVLRSDMKYLVLEVTINDNFNDRDSPESTMSNPRSWTMIFVHLV